MTEYTQKIPAEKLHHKKKTRKKVYGSAKHTRKLKAAHMNIMKVVYAKGMRKNIKTREDWYFKFCSYYQVPPFPVPEAQLADYAMYLVVELKSIQTIKAYCGTVCHMNELQGFPLVRRGRLYQETIQGIRRHFKYESKKAAPIMLTMLKKIQPLVNICNGKQVAIWVTMLLGFFMLLRKSNLVTDTKRHDPVHNLTHRDVRFHRHVMVFMVRWTKTIQWGQRVLPLPMVADYPAELCPVRWVLHLINLIPAHPSQNLLSYLDSNGWVTPVMYWDLTEQMREWLRLRGVWNVNRFSSHSLRRGVTGHAFNNKNLCEQSVKAMGDWRSQAYREYIDVTVEHRVKAWYQFSH